MHCIAHIGAGRIGQIHAQNVFQHENLRLKYIINHVEDHASSLAKKLMATATTLDVALSDPEITGIIIASSTDTHLDISIKAAEAGKAIFCEKPLDLALEPARLGTVKLSELNAQFFIGFNRRFDPHFLKLRDKLHAGSIGNLETIHVISHDPSPPPVSYIESSGGLFKDMTIHDFDMARWLLNEEPVQIFAAGGCLIDDDIGRAGDIDTAMITLKTASGRMAFISNSRRSSYGYDQRIEAYGSTGRLGVNNIKESCVEQWGENGCVQDNLLNFFLDRYANAYQREIDHFSEILNGQAEPSITALDGLRALELAEAANQSHEQGAPISCSLT